MVTHTQMSALNDAVNLLDMMGDRLRLAVLDALVDGDLTFAELQREMGNPVELSATLAVLVWARLVRRQRQRCSDLYSLSSMEARRLLIILRRYRQARIGEADVKNSGVLG